MYIWVKSCRMGKKCPNFTLTQRVALSKPSILQTWGFYPIGWVTMSSVWNTNCGIVTYRVSGRFPA